MLGAPPTSVVPHGTAIDFASLSPAMNRWAIIMKSLTGQKPSHTLGNLMKMSETKTSNAVDLASDEQQIALFIQTLDAHAAPYKIAFNAETRERLARYFHLVLRWNNRANLFSFKSPAEFAVRHVLESCAANRFIADDAKLIDIGSGGGAPAIPLLLIKPNVRGKLIEATTKKAVFLTEALRETGLDERVQVINHRFEDVEFARLFTEDDARDDNNSPENLYLTCRALERFAEQLPHIIRRAPPGARFVLFGGEAVRLGLEDYQSSVCVEDALLLPNTERRFIFSARKL